MGPPWATGGGGPPRFGLREDERDTTETAPVGVAGGEGGARRWSYLLDLVAHAGDFDDRGRFRRAAGDGEQRFGDAGRPRFAAVASEGAAGATGACPAGGGALPRTSRS